ncbi:hypothetical protein [Komagataeibacter medellinensis]|uniref:Helicase/UvrB N-terminal domain-containing protein n=1 Tax=Komagataeibacter medellinensis (strain NBRC 3288 / BCRC 11682 / LMG 1693 / Kondo 51) TaxID=634177 RepID=G2I6V6_KOMMN|nr:hypothetical protein [Komagataeibacter medellinensis]BAK83853.1 hypothetical protein GLX_14410 [Komagataeibacter medellinensis NBRC 3288]
MAQYFKINAPCGAGKTYALPRIINYIHDKDKIAVISQPKIDNLKETETTLSGLGFSVFRFDSEKNTSPVSDIIGFLSGSPKKTDILLVTHAGLMEAISGLGHTNTCLDRFVLIIDEAPAIFGTHNIQLKQHFRLITDNVSLVNDKKTISECNVKNPQPLKKFRDDQTRDDINAVMGPISKILLDPTIEVSTLTSNFKNPTTSHLEFFWHRTPEIFDSFNAVIMMSADFDQSICHNVWSKKYNVTFTDMTSKVQLRYDKHTNTDNTTIHFFMARKYSKKLGSSDNYNVHNQMVGIIERIINGQDCLTILNNDINTDVEEAIRLPTHFIVKNVTIPNPDSTSVISSYVHGLNQYQHINNVAFLASLNLPDQAETYLMGLGLNEVEIEQGILLASTYQAVSRTSIRNPDNNAERHIFVPDSRSMDFLQERFPQASIVCHESEMFLPEENHGGRPPLSSSGAMTQAQRDEQKQERKRIKDECQWLLNEIEWNDSSKFDACIIDDIKTTGIVKRLEFNDADEIIDFFKKEENFTSYDKKTPNRLIWPALVDTNPLDSGTRFGKNNVLFSSFIMLDKDEGYPGHDMTMDDFRQTFPEIKMCMYQTYSGPGNFRVVIPLERPVTGEAWEVLTREISRIMYEKGFKDKGGNLPFDDSKYNCASKFYLPNHEPMTDMDFRLYDGEVLDPFDIIDKALVVDKKHKDQPLTPEERVVALNAFKARLSSEGKNQGDYIQSKIEDFESLPDGSGRYAKFFGLGCILARNGFDETEIRDTLMACRYTGLIAKNKAQRIESIIKSLRKRGLL